MLPLECLLEATTTQSQPSLTTTRSRTWLSSGLSTSRRNGKVWAYLAWLWSSGSHCMHMMTKRIGELYIQAVFAIWLAHSSSAMNCIDFFTKAFSWWRIDDNEAFTSECWYLYWWVPQASVLLVHAEAIKNCVTISTLLLYCYVILLCKSLWHKQISMFTRGKIHGLPFVLLDYQES